MQGSRSGFQKMRSARADDLIDQTVFNTLLCTHETVSLGVPLNNVKWLSGVIS
jgi:hypothetical protein